MMVIRQEQPADYDEVYRLVKASFATSTNDGEWDYLNEVRKKKPSYRNYLWWR